MLTPGPFSWERGFSDAHYGLGVMLFELGGDRVVGHGGFWGSMVLAAPDHGLVVVANVNQAMAGERALDAAFASMELALETSASATDPAGRGS
jgi:CubicO group peptidase (beta-lactamase class C family)